MAKAKKWIIQVVIIILVLLLFSGYAFIVKSRVAPVQEVVATPVHVTSPQLGSAEQNLKLTGFISNDTTVTILPKVAGTLKSVAVKTGDFVEKDQVIAKIDDEPYAPQLSQALAAYTATKAAWERIQALYKSNSISEQNYDTAEAEFLAAKSQYNLAQLQYDYTSITAPVSGSVLQVYTEAGNTVAESIPIVTIGSTESLAIKLSVPERYFPLFQNAEMYKNDTMFIEIPVLEDKKVAVSLQTVAPYISPKTRTFEIECYLSETEGIYAGMFARLYFAIEKHTDVYTLPYSVLIGGNTIWYEKDGLAQKLILEPVFEGDEAFVIPDEYSAYNFIYEGQHFLKEGDSIRILQEGK